MAQVQTVPMTPETPAWASDFADNFSSLQGIALATNHPLYSQLAHIKNVAGSLHWQIKQWLQIGLTDPARASQGLRSMSANVYAWLNVVNDFASKMRGETTATGTIDAIASKASDWVNEFRDFVSQGVDLTVGEFKAAAAEIDAAGAFLVDALPWIALGVGLLIFGPMFIRAIED